MIFLAGCNNRKEPEELIISGNLVNYSDCKLNSMDYLKFDGWDTNYCFNYNFNDSVHILKMQHLNAIFNCCPDELYAEIEEINDTLIIREFEKANYCSCVCQYDLEFEFNGIERKKYLIKLIVPKYYYATGDNPLIFEIDLEAEANGQYCW